VTVIMTRGLPASGKTTWAKEYVRDNPGTIRFNNDEFSYMTTGFDDGRSFEPMDASYLARMRQEAIKVSVLKGVDIVLDNTNLSAKALAEVLDFVGVHEVRFVDFKTSTLECLDRNWRRGMPIPQSVIIGMARRYYKRYDWIEPHQGSA
jgi:predicted kinase